MKKTFVFAIISVLALATLTMSSCIRILSSTVATALDSTYNAAGKSNSFCVGYSVSYSSMLTSIASGTLRDLSSMQRNIQRRRLIQYDSQNNEVNGKYYDKDGKEIYMPPVIKKSDIWWYPYDCIGQWRPTITNVKYAGQDITDEKSFGCQWFSPKNMLRNVTFDLRFGWQNGYSFFVPYVSTKYNFHSVYTRFPADEERLKNKIHSACFGGGVQLLPFRKKAARNRWKISPAFEVGTEYEFYTKCKSYYGKDKKQFKNGMNMHYGMGVNMLGLMVTMITADIGGHDIFNTDYSPDGVSKPYEDIKSNKYSIGFTTLIYF